MTDVRIQGNATPARIKPIAAAVAPHAKQLLEGKRDGFDTYGVKTDSGDQLVLTTSKKPLKTSDFVTVDGKQAAVTFVENEANTFGERFKAPFKSKGGKIALVAGAGIAMAIATPFGVAFGVAPLGMAIGLVLWGGVGTAIMAGGMAAFSAIKSAVTKVKTDESVTDGIAGK